jgi:DNA gyrase subunit A
VVMTAQGVVIRQAAKDIRVIGRNTQGVRLIKLDDEDAIADIAIVTHEEEDIEGAAEGLEGALELASEGAAAVADENVEITDLDGHTANGHAQSDDDEM